MITKQEQQSLVSLLTLTVPKGNTWILVIPEIGHKSNGDTTYLSPINDPRAMAAQLRAVANAIDPQN